MAQDAKSTEALARQYYQNANFEKSAILYEELFQKEKNNSRYYVYLFNSLIRLNEYNKLEKIVKKQIRKHKTDYQYVIDLGYVYAQNNKATEAEKQYEIALKNLSADIQQIRGIAYKFERYRLHEYLIKTYEKGNKLFKNDAQFAYELGNALIKANQIEKALDYWLDLLAKKPSMKNLLLNRLTHYLEIDGFEDTLESKLYEKLQKQSNNTDFSELLIWLFSHQKRFDKALVQAKALDKRQKKDGYMVFRLAQNAMEQKDYAVAIDAYQYILSKSNSFYHNRAKAQMLKAQKLKITENPNYSDEDLKALRTSYTAHIASFENGRADVNSIVDLANLEAKYLRNAKEGVRLLNELLQRPQLKSKTRNEIKLNLGDLYILTGDVWEAILIYSQVDKDEKDSPLGEDARFRKAKLSYYAGEFEWAQAQLNVLKGATSELIANDALDLAIFIQDNLGLDTTTTAMEIYSQAELLLIQNQSDDALALFDNLLKKYPQHALSDDILMQKAKLFIQKRKYEQAEAMLQALLLSYSYDILGDNATFLLAELYEKHLNKPTKAKEYYQKIITDYSDSIFLNKARKRFRKLRGDSF